MATEIFGKSQKLNKSLIKKLLMLFVAALLVSFSLNYFIIPLGILSAGLGGFVQGFSYTIAAITDHGDQFVISMYWGILLILDIPIAIFTYFYYGKKLCFLSIYTFLMMVFVSFFFSYVPGFKDAQYLTSESSVSAAEMLILSIIGGSIYGLGIGMIFLQGSTSLGLDPITRYYGREKGYNFAKITLLFSIISSFIWIIIVQTITVDVTSYSIFITDVIFSPTIIGSLTFIFAYALIVGYIYPTSRKYLVEINSKLVYQISTKLIEMNYHRGHTIEEIVGGYTKEKRLVIKILINSEEFNDIVKIVRDIDPDAFIYATQAKHAYAKNQVWNPETLEDKDVRKNREKYFKKKDKK